MPKLDLPAAVARLVDAATGESSEAAQRRAVNDVLRAFDADDAKGVRAALALLRDGLRRAQGRGTQVLHLTIGALVESGAPPDGAWPAVEEGLRDRLVHAASFARALLKRTDEDADEAALAQAASEIAAARPRDAAAWRELPAHCLAAIACLTRSPKLRKKARTDAVTTEMATALADAVDEAGLLAQVLRLLEGEEVVVFHAPTKQAFRVVVSDVATNAELAVLVGDALARDPKSGVKLAVRLPARAIETLRGERAPGATPKEIQVPFELAPFTALDERGELPEHEHDRGSPQGDHDHSHDHLAPFDGMPADFPSIEGKRVVVVDDPAHDVRIMAEPSLPALSPRVDLRGSLAPAATKRLLEAIARARAPQRKRAKPRR
jgi:hypothetical protein